MAVPGSGILYFGKIAKELKWNNYYTSTSVSAYLPIGLTEMSTGTWQSETINTNNAASNRPNQVVPHYVNEFYSYNHDEIGAVKEKVYKS